MTATVLVADTEDGKPIAADGPLKLVATRETSPARWVRNLVGVRVLGGGIARRFRLFRQAAQI